MWLPVDRPVRGVHTAPVSDVPAAPLRNPGLGIALRIAAMACVASLYATVKWAGARGIPVFEIVLFRSVFAFVPLGVHIWLTTGPEVLRTKQPLAHLRRAGSGLLGMVCSFAALQHLPLTEATAIQFAAPLFMVAMSALLLGEAVGKHRWGAVLVGFVGVLIMVRPQPGHMNLLGAGLALASALGSAGAMVAIRQMSAVERGPTIVFYFTLAGVALGLAGSLFHWVTPDPLTLAVLIGGGLIGGVAQLFLTEAVRQAPIGVVAPFDYTQLIWATIIGLMVWGELPRSTTLVGAAVVTASGLYILHREIVRRRRA